MVNRLSIRFTFKFYIIIMIFFTIIYYLVEKNSNILTLNFTRVIIFMQSSSFKGDRYSVKMATSIQPS